MDASLFPSLADRRTAAKKSISGNAGTADGRLNVSRGDTVGVHVRAAPSAGRLIAGTPVVAVAVAVSAGVTVVVACGSQVDALPDDSRIPVQFEVDVDAKRRDAAEQDLQGQENSDADDHDHYGDEDCNDDDLDDDDDSSDESSNVLSHSYVSDLSIVTGVPFYGYHLQSVTFLKISLTSPKYVTRLARLLGESKIFNKFIQPYESHIPYNLQFLIDYNCYTLKEINITDYLWRTPLVIVNDSYNVAAYQTFFETYFTLFNSQKIDSNLKRFLNEHIYQLNSRINVLDPESLPRIGRTMVELDIVAGWIANRSSLKERQIPQLCVNATQDDKVQFISSTKSLLDDVDNLRKSRGLPIGGSQLGLFDKTPRNVSSSTEWNNHEEIDKLFLNCVKLSEKSYYEKFKDLDFTRLESCKANTSFPSSFRSIDNLHYFPDPNPSCLLNTDMIDFKSDDIFDQLLICSKSFRSSSSSFMENRNNFSQTNHHNTGNPTSDLKDEVIESDTENDEEVEMNNESGEIGTNPDHSVSNLTEKLQEASTLEDSVVFDNSDLFFLESTQSDHTRKKPIEPSSFTQRERLAAHELFTNYFTDSDYSEKIYSFNLQQPKVHSKDEFLNSFQTNYHMLKIEYPDPFYSKLSNFDPKPFIFAGEKFQLKCTEVDTNLYPSGTQLNTFTKGTDDLFIWNYIPKMPSLGDVKGWLEAENVLNPPSFVFHSQTKGPTQKFKGFKYGSLKTPPERMANSRLTLDQLLLIVEIHINTTGDKMPDPKLDEIAAVFWKTNIENFTYDRDFPGSGSLVRADSLTAEEFLKVSNETDQSITRYESEYEMIIGLVSLVEYLDPDILVGFELHSLSWGFILERAKHKFNIDLCQRLSRVVFKHNNKVGDRWGYTHASGIRITGRQLFNLWRRLRSELNLNHYSLENIIFHIFHVRIPTFSWKQLTGWWVSGQGKYLSYVLNYHNSRIKYEMELITKLEIVEKINEQSRLLGIDFYSMIYRGSQFKVECLLVRLAKAENFMLISPSKKQVFKQDSLECIPLVMEPNSALFKSPLVVLDFQSLYPSLIIAYNICYSTMLGKLKNYNPYKYTKMGVANYKTSEGILKLLESDINLSPNGVMFAKQNVRKSLLAKMLTEILNARIYIKSTMSEFKDDDALRKLYNNRQLALKLIANVTYGYTSASYSGRMPNSDVADAIVSCGRETLLKAVKEIEKNSKWGAKVVYGDTDSLFVYLPGKTKADAFRIGKEMANHVTSLNPEPVKLKFEKVYLPSILLSKKRYIGWSYEYESQINPKFDAKGIETVRRDGIPAQQKILERAILMLFKTKDISQIKEYILDEFMKILKNKINLQDFLFAKEVRLGTYKNEKYIPPGARLSMKRIQKDHRSEPQYKERVFYLVRKGHSKEILRDRCVSPEDFLSNAAMELDSDYYINKVLIPPLERVFNLFGVDVRAWVREIPKMLSYTGVGVKLLNVKVISCICCHKSETLKTSSGGSSLCENCKKEELRTMLTLKSRLKTEEKKSMNYINFCRSCSANTVGEAVGSDVARSCCNVDCSVYYSRIKVFRNTDTMIREYQKIPDW
ncbi:hypothetical protein PMKS-002302 [Pichia membranifaciens]|uniref:DNA polymerase n=1 Tax=Pichia membranifaciens TaxID=4926 RepID=A0A1Q2YH56_9ASCO|nr:hypothetical protein PMKS-002302 [Pichia membranifaciens]